MQPAVALPRRARPARAGSPQPFSPLRRGAIPLSADEELQRRASRPAPGSAAAQLFHEETPQTVAEGAAEGAAEQAPWAVPALAS